MALILVIENGTKLVDANSYASFDSVREYNAQRGVSLPTDDDALIVLMTKALDFLEGMESEWKGNRASATQALAWPRNCAVLYSTPLSPDVVPFQIVRAQCYLAGVANTVDLAGVKTTAAVKLKTIGPITTEYDTGKGATVQPVLPLLTSMLAPLRKSGNSALTSVRV